ncbi:hypothetical protein [Streptomyces canus]|uniref:hypothetical protein n=1 Tax=Streptomyces canus TaxID=58343 RepID=UPI0036E11111
MVVLSVTVPRLVPAPFSDSGEGTATDTAVPLLLIAAVLQFFDCAQHIGWSCCAASTTPGADSGSPSSVTGWPACPSATLLGLAAGLNTFGVRLGLLTGLATTAVLLLGRFNRGVARLNAEAVPATT